MSSPSVSLSFGSASPPLSATLTQMFSSLDAAAEQLMVHRDFHAAFHTCERGLESLACVEEEDNNRCGELKAGFCILGIQALAELNQWRGVLAWVLQHYEHLERIPAKIIQMCILLYSKVGEPAAMQEAARVWLHCPSNGGVAGFGTVAELYLLHVLVPLGHTEEARDLVLGDVGGGAFTGEQRQIALEVVEEEQEAAADPDCSPDCKTAAHAASHQGTFLPKLKAMLRLLYRRLSASGSGSFPVRRLFLAAVLLYMLFLRLDPALPSSFVWISKLLQLLRQTWSAAFAPHHHHGHSLPHSKGL